MIATRQSGAVSRKLIIWLAVPALIVVLIAGYWTVEKKRYEQARKARKNEALAQLSKMAMTNEAVLTEIDQLRHPTSDPNIQWANDHVLLMTNSEFLVYAFYHGFNNGLVDHLFLAHGSDGKWYYSTYHFCNGMAGVLGEDPPGSIAEFARSYAVREFDGQSEICLRHTWP